MAGNKYGQLVLLAISIALLAWAGVPIRRWAEGVPLVHDDDDSELGLRYGGDGSKD
tara:strand:- start:650 stop:817 length:168 start_codon:yes stop_codon:yes gene_type:complete